MIHKGQFLVGQNNARGSVVLIVCEGSCSRWGVDQPSVSNDFGVLPQLENVLSLRQEELSLGLMDSRPQMPSVLSRTKGLLGQRK